MFDCPYLIEILTPKRSNVERIEDQMETFAERYCRAVDSGNGVSIPDNPMGEPRYSGLEAIESCKLPVDPARTVINLNTFHTKDELDSLLRAAARTGLKYLLVVRGDGGSALPKLKPGAIGGIGTVATSSDLIRYIHIEYPHLFVTGVAFNQYSPIYFETERVRQKIEAGAKFVVTQPVIGKDPHVDLLGNFDIPVVIEAWMSKKVDLLYKSVRKEKEERAQGYDPVDNLRILHESYPEKTIYLSMLSFSQDWRLILPRL
jgi:methylenetetrahydrofolate reductase (NADPH)